MTSRISNGADAAYFEDPEPVADIEGLEFLDVDTLDLIYDVGKDYIKEQSTRISIFDTKAGFVLGSASLLTTGVAAFGKSAFDVASQMAKEGKTLELWQGNITICLVAIALLMYLAIIFCGYQAYKPTNVAALSQIGTMRDIYLQERKTFTKLAVLNAMVDIIEENDYRIQDKANWTGWAVRALIGEAFAIGALIVMQMIVYLQAAPK